MKDYSYAFQLLKAQFLYVLRRRSFSSTPSRDFVSRLSDWKSFGVAVIFQLMILYFLSKYQCVDFKDVCFCFQSFNHFHTFIETYPTHVSSRFASYINATMFSVLIFKLLFRIEFFSPTWGCLFSRHFLRETSYVDLDKRVESGNRWSGT